MSFGKELLHGEIVIQKTMRIISKVASVKTSGKYFCAYLKECSVDKTGYDAFAQKDTTAKKLIAKKMKYKLLPAFIIHGGKNQQQSDNHQIDSVRY